ncbi:HAMP domain-containing sensor histidine kinase [Pleurocapsa sp. PCC 7319]|uniref:ATP-binding response regulator n=1 Tax=Pleurocapsa sp. PCC 7319 TaxID=118161 RepID=UPI00034CC555|nr:HAMP domain-containing sensor histidine kinase [Pleurocapsa sp. PCC 7319]
MKRILVLVGHDKNRHLLSQYLEGQYQILSPQTENNFLVEGVQLLESEFDLCFIDFSTIHQLRQQMLARRDREIPLFLPFVFLTSLQDVGLSTDHLEPLIDDIIYLPAKKAELRTKLRVLLRSRSYSLQLQAAQAELNQALAQEKELNQLKSRFVSIVSHEFRNPLNSISGMAQILEAYGDKLTPDKKTEVFQQLKCNVTKMTELLDDVLIISRKDVGKLQFNPAPLDLESFCRGLISEIQTIYNYKQSVNFVYPEIPAKQFALDRKLLHHILTNLLANACKYSPQDSTIDFEVDFEPTNELVFTIRDRGMGIPAKDIPNLFDPFYRASNSEGIQGTGLGLAIVKQYVELHQGVISVESELETGTTFKVTISSKIDN